MSVPAEARYRVFGSPAFRGNPVTLYEVAALGDGAALLHAAGASATEDNVFFLAVEGAPVLVRFFSSTAELWLCGHGLLALAQHLLQRGIDAARAVHSPHGTWHIFVDAQGPGVLLPAQRAEEVVDSTHWLQQALRSSGIGYERLYECPNGVWVVLLRDMAALLAIKAETVAMLPCGAGTPGALIAALPLPDAGYGFRYFAPWHGKPEDSGTGSAHCYLAPLLARTHAPVTVRQFSPLGVAEMRVCLRGDAVEVAGSVERCT